MVSYKVLNQIMMIFIFPLIEPRGTVI